MKVLIVSDTHGRHAGIEEAIEREYRISEADRILGTRKDSEDIY